MKFNRINIDSSTTKKVGIEEIKLERLSNLIGFIGKNGSGKTRILDLIESQLIENLEISDIIDGTIAFAPKELENFKKEVDAYASYFKYEDTRRRLSKIKPELLTEEEKTKLVDLKKIEQTTIRNQITDNATNNKISKIKKNFIEVKNLIKSKYIRRIKYDDIKKLQLAIEEDGTNLTFELLIEKVAENSNYNEIDAISKSALKFLTKLPHQLALDQYLSIANDTKIEDKASYRRFRILRSYVTLFLNKELTWSSKLAESKLTDKGHNVVFEGMWSIDGRLFNYSELSDGERLLFSYALLFFLIDVNPSLNIKSSLIIIDEPELHLHANSEIELLEGIKKVVGEKGQIIIATHSINILSHLNYEEIFLVKQGKITHPSSVSAQNSLSELIEIENRINKISDFLNSISLWTQVNYMAECFLDPEVIESSKENDPQVADFKKAIQTLNHNSEDNIVLDFGAGKGRILKQIKTDERYTKKLNYQVLEPDVQFHKLLKEQGADKIYKEVSELPRNYFNFVLLCNVLHEIPILEWEFTLNKIIDSLKSNGYIIIIEATVLNKGEKIDQAGYIIMKDEELGIVFQNVKDISSLIIPESQKSTCVVLNRKNVNYVSKDTLILGLKKLEKRTLSELEQIRTDSNHQSNLYSKGRLSAFLSQQHINAKIGQVILKKNKE